jgi:predicted exporter
VPSRVILRTKILIFLWVVGISAISVWLITDAENSPGINSNVMTLLPKAERDPVVHRAMTQVEKRFQRYVTILVGADEFATAVAAAKHVTRRLADSQKFDTLRLKHHQDVVPRIISFYLPLRFQLLSNKARGQLLAGNVDAFERSVLQRYYNPDATVSSDLIDKDPLLLLPQFLEERVSGPTDRPKIEAGYLTVKAADKIYVVLVGELSETPFSVSLQRSLIPLLDTLRSDLTTQFAGADFLMAGVLPHAAAGTNSAIDEVSTVGLGSLIGVILLLLIVFRSSRPFLLTLGSIGLGCLGGFAACLAVFGEVHLLTLAFGASLVGISVDYSLHYFCERFRSSTDWSSTSALRHVFPGITLGLITSIIGFAGLFFAPFPGMQGMAVFSVVGLCIGYGSVVICYPQFSRRMAQPKFQHSLNWVRAYGALWERRGNWRIWTVAFGLVAAVIVGCLQLNASDDVRLLQSPNDAVMAEEVRAQGLVGRKLSSQFYLVEGSDEADFLMREENLTEALRELEKEEQLSGYLAISDFIASPARQAENHALLAPLVVGKENALHRIAQQIGLPDSTRKAFAAKFENGARITPVELHQWLLFAGSEPYRHLWLGNTERGVVGVVGLRGAYDLTALQKIAAADPSVHFIDPVGEVSHLFGQYRRQTIWLTLISYGVVMLILVGRYGLTGGLLVIAPPVVAAFASLGALGFLGESISLFNVMGLLLVLGIGVDYALFFRETGGRNPATLLAIALSSLTTLLAFGLLALSATTAIHSFGLTILIGIVVAFLLSPMAGWHIGTVKRKNRVRL